MAKKFATLRAAMPAEDRALAQKKTKLLIQQVRLRQLKELRQNREVSQAALAEMLSSTQASVSKIESRDDFYLSTLREYIEALGGELEILARFPEGAVSLGDMNVAKPISASPRRQDEPSLNANSISQRRLSRIDLGRK
ncbi:MAG: XRE family transcriptional regulator [Gemmatimonas sp.]